ncbi:hypothetical protein CGLO_18229 [Colletotrichum gloeosporioides Cg-14]|uniref:Uncharacterized protein n=1 Tax=Colletotrichum gloeosporioides (strain Cg-14) TaxID=1237896 RepID=T0L4J5_COLGC|nr:hypothetical protein CGLO_18229 [Colletotrichum gloeosporioides Cg-14]
MSQTSRDVRAAVNINGQTYNIRIRKSRRGSSTTAVRSCFENVGVEKAGVLNGLPFVPPLVGK